MRAPSPCATFDRTTVFCPNPSHPTSLTLPVPYNMPSHLVASLPSYPVTSWPSSYIWVASTSSRHQASAKPLTNQAASTADMNQPHPRTIKSPTSTMDTVHRQPPTKHGATSTMTRYHHPPWTKTLTQQPTQIIRHLR